MLGLGDIVIPGIFLSLCLKFDIDKFINKKSKSLDDLKIVYHTTSFIGYGIGMIITYGALIIMNQAQPALLFLVPTCTLSVVLVSLIRG